MFDLPAAFVALRPWQQFIVYRREPGTPKTKKYPVNFSGQKHDAHDPAIWLDVDAAAGMAEMLGPGHGVGFVFTDSDPFFFLDIDACLDEGGNWSELANDMCGRFAGAAIEVSQSGTGLHIIGSGAFGAGPPPPARRTKYLNLLELYTEKRFVALTGYHARGDAGTMHAPALTALVAQYFKGEGFEVVDELTNSPVAAWSGPTDDQDLIARAIKSASTANTFGGKASFADLWYADANKLAMFFPGVDGDPYNASQADSALAQLLCFWTGNDGERIMRLMRLSALVREKWDRPDYLPRTIKGVMARQFQFLTDKKKDLVVQGETAMEETAHAEPFTGQVFLPYEDQIELLAGCVYVADRHRALVPGGDLLKPDQFKARFGGYAFPLDLENKKVTDNAWDAFLLSQQFRSPRATSIMFRPELPPATMIEEGGRMLVNVWWPITTERKRGDAGPFTTHLAKMLPDAGDRAQLLAYMAACVQYPGKKFQWAPLIQGIEGNGKTFLIAAVIQAIGERYAHLPKVSSMAGDAGRFTGWIEQKLFVGLEEIKTDDRRELMETLKPLITNTRIEIQYKGQDQFTGDNRANFMACSNHKDAVPKHAEDRRWAIFYCAQQNKDDLKRDGLDGDYMVELWKWAKADGFAIVNDYLRSYAIPDELNPATKMHRAPDTSSTAEAIGLSVGNIEQEIQEAIDQNMPGFAGGWVSSIALSKLLHAHRVEKAVPLKKRRELMKTLGYDYHPNLGATDGRMNNVIAFDGGKPRLFIKIGHPLQNLVDQSTIAKRYEDDQNKAVADRANFAIDASGNKR